MENSMNDKVHMHNPDMSSGSSGLVPRATERGRRRRSSLEIDSISVEESCRMTRNQTIERWFRISKASDRSLSANPCLACCRDLPIK